MVDETGHPPEADDRVCGLVGTVQGHSGLACQGSKGRPDAEDTLLAVNVKLEVSQAVRLVLDPQGLLRVLPELDPAEVDAVVLQRYIRTYAEEIGPCERTLSPCGGWGDSLNRALVNGPTTGMRCSLEPDGQAGEGPGPLKNPEFCHHCVERWHHQVAIKLPHMATRGQQTPRQRDQEAKVSLEQTKSSTE